jgi:TetR/AcrR family transcriptional regulator, tetracycline repressor protein
MRSAAPSRRNSERLQVDSIVTAAMDLIRAGGVDGLTMAGLAKQLGSSVTAPYYYVPDKQALIDLVAERVGSSIVVPLDTAGWREQLHDLVVGTVTAFLPYPGLAIHALSRESRRTSVRRRVRDMSQILESAGFNDETVHSAVLALGSLMQGVLIVAPITRDTSLADQGSSAGAEADADFESALNLVLDGIEARTRSSGTH